MSSFISNLNYYELSVTLHCQFIFHILVKYYPYDEPLSPLTLFQCKIDKMIMFHAIAKFFDRCAGGTSLKKQLGVYVSSHTMKLKVLIRSLFESVKYFCILFLLYASISGYYVAKFVLICIIDILFVNESLNVHKMQKMGCIGKFM